MQLDDYMDTREAAELLGITRKSVARLAAEGKITATKIGRDWWLLRQSVQEFFEATKDKEKYDPTRGQQNPKQT